MSPNAPADRSSQDFSTSQEWDSYSPEQHAVWGELYDRRMRELTRTASRVYLAGAEVIGLGREGVPNLDTVNRQLRLRTGWQAVPVTGFIPAKDFFSSLAQRRFPTTVTIRRREEMDYLPEPDIFHDVFGHVPLHAEPVFADFLHRFGQLAVAAQTEQEVLRMARLFWFTVEFGLIREEGSVRVYGSGLISSAGDAANALSSACEKRPFDLTAVLEQPFEIDHFQNVLFVLDSFEELFAAVEDVGRVM